MPPGWCTGIASALRPFPRRGCHRNRWGLVQPPWLSRQQVQQSQSSLYDPENTGPPRLSGYYLYFFESPGAIHYPSGPLPQFCMMSPLAHDAGEGELQLTVNAYSGLIWVPLCLHLSPRDPAKQDRPGHVRAALPRQHSEASGCIQGLSPGPDPFSRCCGPKCKWQGGLDLEASPKGAGVYLPQPPEALPTGLDLLWGGSFLPEFPVALEVPRLLSFVQPLCTKVNKFGVLWTVEPVKVSLGY